MRTLALLCRPSAGTRGDDAIWHNARRAQLLLCLCFAAGFAAICVRLALYALSGGELPVLAVAGAPPALAKTRPDIVDRNGRLLATDVRIYWLGANPRLIVRAEEAAEKLTSLFPDLDPNALAARFRAKPGKFEWVKRGLTPKQAEAVHRLGIPGLTLAATNRRAYPAGHEAAHVLGFTDVENEGKSGIELYIDQKLTTEVVPTSLTARPIVKLSLDLGVQHAITEELMRAMTRYRATAALGLILDVRNGEILASVSLPDFDPNRREQAAEANRDRNRVVIDNYELGSVFKSFTIAMALDQGVAGRYDRFDAGPLPVGTFLLHDAHAKSEPTTVEDIFVHSLNTGAARIAIAAGPARQQAFLKALGLFDRMETEAGLSQKPRFPEVWRPANAATIAYGHGIAVPPIAFAAAMAAIVNGGRRIAPTFFLATSGGEDREQVIRPETSVAMRELMRLVVERGTGRRAAVPGLDLGGKTGTALKVKDGHYTHDVINSFVAAIPIGNPRYLILVTLDEPKPAVRGEPNEAAYNAAPTVGAIVKRIAPMLDILPTPRFDEAPATPYERSGIREFGLAALGKKAHEAGGFDPGYSAFGQPQRPGEPGHNGNHGR